MSQINRVFYVLVSSGEKMTASEILKKTGFCQNTVKSYLSRLVDYGLVEPLEAGYYRFKFNHVVGDIGVPDSVMVRKTFLTNLLKYSADEIERLRNRR